MYRLISVVRIWAEPAGLIIRADSITFLIHLVSLTASFRKWRESNENEQYKERSLH